MSVGDEWAIVVIVIVALLIHVAIAAGIGFVLSRIHRKTLGLVGFMLFYLGIAVLYTATFSFQMLIYSTPYLAYVIVGLIGYVLGAYLLGENGYRKHIKKVLGHE